MILLNPTYDVVGDSLSVTCNRIIFEPRQDVISLVQLKFVVKGLKILVFRKKRDLF